VGRASGAAGRAGRLGQHHVPPRRGPVCAAAERAQLRPAGREGASLAAGAGRPAPLRIPQPLARGVPGRRFPWPWSVYRWLPGTPLANSHITQTATLAADLAAFLAALYRIDPAGGPGPGEHSFYRGGSPAVYDGQTRDALKALDGEIDTVLAAQVWEEALAAEWDGNPVWVHGDIADGNLLTERGRLSAVIDFGCCAVGDPSCDTVIAWTYFSGESRELFKQRLPVARATWARGRGWALWKAIIVLVEALRDDPDDARATKKVIAEVLSDKPRT
jgi:aminoglycoside phosphotransferase (APT) family kinase protein